MDRETRAITDRNFEVLLLGNKQSVIEHKHYIGQLADGREAWHICTFDSNEYYDSSWYAFDRREMEFERLSVRPTVVE